MTNPPGAPDDPVSQFSDPELKYQYAESPAPAAWGPPPDSWQPSPAGPAGGPYRRRKTRAFWPAVILIAVVLAATAGYLLH
jgi:hypothetical protein